MKPLSFLQKLLAILILAIIIFFSLFHLTESPPFSFDEGWASHIASNISEVGIDGTQFAPDDFGHVPLISVGYTLIYTLAFWFKVFGVGVLQARTMMVLYMLALSVSSFLLIRRLYGNAIALSALALLSTFPPFYSFGKNVIGEVPVLTFLILFLLFFNLAINNPKKKLFWFILSGVSAGLCVISKTMALAFLPVLFVGTFIAYRKKLTSWKDIGIIAISAAVPIIVWFIVQFHPGESLSYVADFYTNPSALTDRSVTFWMNLKIMFTRSGPLFALTLMAAWIAGIAIRLKTKVRVYFEEYISLIFSIVILLSLLFRYWDARYLFPVQAIVVLFAPYSIHYLVQILFTKFGISKKEAVFNTGIVILSILGVYQLSFDSYVAESYNSTRTKNLSEYFSSIPDSTSIFFYNTPNVLIYFHGRNYYQRIAAFEKWVMGNEFSVIASEDKVDMLVLNPPMTKADENVSLDRYEKIKEFGKTSIYKRKTAI